MLRTGACSAASRCQTAKARARSGCAGRTRTAARAEETCRGLQQAVRSSLTELNALSGAFECEEEAVTGEETGLPEDPALPDDTVCLEEDTPAETKPEDASTSEPEEEPYGLPEDDTPAGESPEEPAAPLAEDAPAKRRTVEIRRHERI